MSVNNQGISQYSRCQTPFAFLYQTLFVFLGVESTSIYIFRVSDTLCPQGVTKGCQTLFIHVLHRVSDTLSIP